MPFSKTFPRKITENSSTVWEEITLTKEEESQVEEECRKVNFRLLDECLQDAKALGIKNSINTDEIRTSLAIALFEKRSSHVIFWKENATKEKFERKFNH